MTTRYDCLGGEVRTKLAYALPNPCGLQHNAKLSKPGSNTLRSNYIPHLRDVTIRDLRGQEDRFSLDRNGFEFVAHETQETFTDETSIRTSYYEEMRQLVKNHTGAHEVFIITHRIRQGYDDSDPKNEGIIRELEPAFMVHTDRTSESVVEEVKKYMESDGERLLQGRVRFINVWRPIGHIVHHEPLGVVDWQTSSDKSRLFPLTIDPSASAGHGYDVLLPRFNTKHLWYFLRHQNPSEALMMKFYDNCTEDGVATFCLHSSFRDPGCHVNAPRRRSIEVNMLAFG